MIEQDHCQVRIVLVEDSKADSTIFQEMLNDIGVEHHLIWLKNGKQAMEYFDDGWIADYIFLDINLPLVNGYRLLEYLIEKGVDVKKIAIMTGSTSQGDREWASRKGVANYFVKPMKIEEMNEIELWMRRTFRI